MPYFNLETNVSLSEAAFQKLSKKLSSALSQTLSKPESKFMIRIDDGAKLSLGGGDEDYAMCSLHSVGTHNLERNNEVSGAVSNVLQESIGIKKENYYLFFYDISPGSVGLKGSTITTLTNF
eukprot:snap_masked-scaffold_11-processed-gene-6.45-mRNA-1 protein AED:1.00 eAED:1.00 QI:0/0/0/0/1/1/2/0/121